MTDKQPLLTIGFAHYDDFTGLWATIQSMRYYHREVMSQVEFIVVDNNPESDQAKLARDFIAAWGSQGNCGARWIPFPWPRGTSAPRDHIFKVARGQYVMVCDPHIMIEQGAITRLLDYYAANPECNDLLHGPLLYDDLETIGGTHFDPIWRSEMEGVWGRDSRAYNVDAEPFEVPAQGLGLFSCRRDAWPGFPEGLIGFGGEECNIHQAFKNRGDRTLCLPFLRWPHRFGRPSVPYPLQRFEKVRNYVIWAKHLGKPIEPIREHFVDTGLMPMGQWDHIVSDPVGCYTPQQSGPPQGQMLPQRSSCGAQGREQPPLDAGIDDIYSWLCMVPRDLDKHLPKLHELASQCEHVTEFTKRRESTAALLAGRPKILRSYQIEIDPLVDRLRSLAEADEQIESVTIEARDSLAIDPIEPTDMLFIDTRHNAYRLHAELKKHAASVRRYIVLHDTELHGEIGDEKGSPGLLPALRQFMKEHPEWSVLYHTREQYGLTVVGCRPEDKPKLPSVIAMAGNFAKAMAEHVADGATKVSKDHLEQRLSVCTMCEHRNADRCSLCGCFLAAKAGMRSSECPIGRWA